MIGCRRYPKVSVCLIFGETMKTRRFISAVAAALCIAGPSSAAIATFEFAKSPGDWPYYYALPSSLSFSEGDLSLTVYGRARAGNTLVDGRVGQYSHGLGVTNSPHDNSHQVDSSGYEDFLEFVFSTPVLLREAEFSLVGSDDDFRYAWDSNLSGRINAGDSLGEEIDIPWDDTWGDDANEDFGSSRYLAWAIGAFDDCDEWKLKSLTVEYTSPVPLPAGLPLLLGAFGAFGVARGCARRSEPGTNAGCDCGGPRVVASRLVGR